MRRPPLPGFVADVVGDPHARSALVAGSAALFAAGLDPKVWSASLPTVQSAIRARPELETVALVGAVVGAALLLVGGALGDSARARPIVLGGLTVELVAAAISLVVPVGPIFVVSRLVGYAAAAFVIPVSLASVATSYSGVARATAIGFAYAAYGAAGALGPILLQALSGAGWPAFVATILACAAAIWIARRAIPDLPRPSGVERPYVVATALWGLGIVTLTTGIVWFGGGWDDPVRWALVFGGVGLIAVAGAQDRRRRRALPGVRVDRRPIAVAIFVGLILAIAQTAPMLQLPLYFQLVLRFGPLLAVAALGPMFAALVLAGPIAGFLLARYPPRTLVAVGVVVVGLGDLGLALLVSPGASYLGFVLPSAMVGAGFVIATTVRTAIIFASVPRGLPATAAALNEASISVGMRIGTVLVTAIVAKVALDSYAASLAGQPAAEVDRAVAAFGDLLAAIGTTAFAQVAAGLDPGKIRPYLDAYVSGIQVAFVFGAVVAVAGGSLAWLLLGRRDPLGTVYEHMDERAAAAVEP
jgi:DHA2 family multidrug resistance protein-like MFS transporter